MNANRTFLLLLGVSIAGACAAPPQPGPSATPSGATDGSTTWVLAPGEVLPRSEALPRTVPMQADVARFLDAAYQADKIADPLARCLKYPAVPGTQWAPPVVQSYCEYSTEPALGDDEFARYLATGDLAGLESRLAADLERHFDEHRFSEVIHRDFAAIDASRAWDERTARWLAAAPHSAFAQAGRAVSYRMQAGHARGERALEDTPPAAIAEMKRLAKLSIDHYRRAAAIEPRLMPVYAGLINVAVMVGDATTIGWAATEAGRIDPGCYPVAVALMRSMQPRWGGSYPAMEQFATHLAPLAAQRPLLGMLLRDAEEDRADVALRHPPQAEGAIALLESVVAQSPSPSAERLLGEALRGRSRDAEGAMHLLSAHRYCACGDEESGVIGATLASLGADPAWAERYLTQGIEADRMNTRLYYSRGSVRLAQGQSESGMQDLRRAMSDRGPIGEASLQALVGELGRRGRRADAGAEIDAILRSDPRWAPAWLAKYEWQQQGGDPAGFAALERYLQLVDRNDVNNAQSIRFAERMLQEHQHPGSFPVPASMAGR